MTVLGARGDVVVAPPCVGVLCWPEKELMTPAVQVKDRIPRSESVAEEPVVGGSDHCEESGSKSQLFARTTLSGASGSSLELTAK